MGTIFGLVVFSHGLESGPWGTKIRRLAEVAKQAGFEVDSLDGSDTRDPAERVRRLVARKPESITGKTVLVGSSLGSYVAALASEHWRPDGLFLLAPAFYIPELPVQEPVPYGGTTVVVHGWRDEIIPAEAAFRYAAKFKTRLHLFDDEHRLIECLPQIEGLFASFLAEIKGD
jgi:predicted esterase